MIILLIITTGSTPLHLAAYNGHRSTCELLLEQKANLIGSDLGGKSISQLIGNSPAEVGFVPLHGASFFGHESTVSCLLDHDAPVDPLGPLNLTP